MSLLNIGDGLTINTDFIVWAEHERLPPEHEPHGRWTFVMSDGRKIVRSGFVSQDFQEVMRANPTALAYLKAREERGY